MSPTSQAHESVTPRDCALALTIPLTREQFLDDLARPERKDYAAHVRRSNEQKSVDEDYYWNEVYGPLAHTVTKICDEVERLGVTVNRSLRLNELADLLRRFRVVTLVAHWRFTRVRLKEVLDAPGFLEALRTPQSRVQQSLLHAFAECSPQLLSGDLAGYTPAELQERVVETINAVLAAAHALYRTGDTEGGVAASAGEEFTPRPLERLTRVAVEQAFPSHIVPGRAIEFSEGMYSVRELMSAVPDDFSGVLDLTVCNSVIIGEVVKNFRPDCIVAVNRYPAELYVRMAFYKQAITLLSRHPAPYMDVLTKIHTGKAQGN